MLFALIGVALLLIWIVTLVDCLRRHDLTTSHKVLWALFVALIPIVGVVAYYIARPPDAIDPYVVSGSTATADEQFRSRHPG